MEWIPISRDEITQIIEEQKKELNADELKVFNEISVDLELSKILRDGVIESAYIIAEFDGQIVFYDDVEEGFEIVQKSDDGVIYYDCSNQYELKHVTNQVVLLTRTQSSKIL